VHQHRLATSRFEPETQLSRSLAPLLYFEDKIF